MRFARSKRLIGAFLWAPALFVFSAVAIGEVPSNERILEEFEKLQERLSAVERSQKDVLAQKGTILEEIDRVRVWVRHSGSKPQTS